MTSKEISTALCAQGFGVLNTSGFYDDVPPDPDIAFSILEYFGGEADEPSVGTGGTLTRLEYPRFQLIVRGVREDNDGPKLRAIQMRAYLVSLINTTLSGVKYVGIEALGPPFFLQKDDNFRRYWVCNFRAIKEPSAS